MKGYVEFTGKTLDEAIKEASSYFGVEREKLEVEIINDAKTGIFGLVGAKKATLRARRVQLGGIGLNFGDEQPKDNAQNGKQAGSKGRGRRNDRKPHAEEQPEARNGQLQVRQTSAIEARKENLPMQVEAGEIMAYEPDAAAASATDAPEAETAAADRSKQRRQPRGRKEGERKERAPKDAEARDGDDKSKRSEGRGRGKRVKDNAKGDERGNTRGQGKASGVKRAVKESPDNGELSDDAMPDFEGSLPVVPLESLDQELLRGTVMEALKELATPIVGEFESGFEVSGGRVRLRVTSAENQGLLIGRDGQTLASLQYLLCCIASRKMNASVRVQIDAGDYREKQDEKLRDLALALAQKVKSSSRPQSTRPLSAYHRRIIHMTLQDDPDVQTHSKGEGGMKRVVVVPRRKQNNAD